MIGGTTSNETVYKPNKVPPENVRPEFYNEVITILNKITAKNYSEKENQEILPFFMVNNTQTDEEFNIKTKLSMLATSRYQIIRTKEEKIKEINQQMFNQELKEIEEILKIHK